MPRRLLPGLRAGLTSLAATLILITAAPPLAAAPAARPALDKSSPQYKQAVALFKKGIKDFDGGYYVQAIEKFKKALELYPSPKIHTRIALCYKWLGNFLKSLHHYELFVKQFKPSSPAEEGLLKRVKTVEIPRLLKMVAEVRIVMEAPAKADIRINGRPVGQAPMDRTIRLNPGPINVSATLKGYYGFKRDLMVARGKSAAVRISLVKIKPKVVKVEVKGTPVYKKWWFWTAIGAVVAGGAAGLGAWLGTREVPRDFASSNIIRHDSLGLRW